MTHEIMKEANIAENSGGYFFVAATLKAIELFEKIGGLIFS